MTTDHHDRIGAMLDDYALAQLSPDERREVESHARECQLCTESLRELTAVMEGLAHVPDPVVPPPALRQRVLSALAAQRQEPSFDASDPKVVQMPSRRATVRRGVHPGWLAAAAMVILAFGTLLYSTDAARRRLTDAVQQANATAADLQRRLDQYAGQADLALSILTAGDMRPIAMAGRENATASAARAYWSPTRGLLIVADRLPVPPPGRIYQVWLIEGGQPVSAGLLGEQASERGMLIVPPPSGLGAGPVTVALTDEPPGGLAAPTGSIRLVGSL